MAPRAIPTYAPALRPEGLTVLLASDVDDMDEITESVVMLDTKDVEDTEVLECMTALVETVTGVKVAE